MNKEDELVGFKFWIDAADEESVHFEVTAALEKNHYYCQPTDKKSEVDGKVLSQKDIEQYKLVNEMFH